MGLALSGIRVRIVPLYAFLFGALIDVSLFCAWDAGRKHGYADGYAAGDIAGSSRELANNARDVASLRKDGLCHYAVMFCSGEKK